MTTPRSSLTAFGPVASPVSLSRAQGFDLRRISSREDWSSVRRLRFDALRSRGEIAENAERFHGDRYDAALNTNTFLLSRHGRALGTARSSVSCATRRWPLPAMDAFGHEIRSALGLDSTIVEASLALVDPSISSDPKNALFCLFKAPMLHCAAENADWLIVAVRDSQIGFYRRIFNMEILSGAESYLGMAWPRVLMGFAYRDQAPLLFKRIPALAVSDADEREFSETGIVSLHP